MKAKAFDNTHALKIQKGESIYDSLLEYVKKNQIGFGIVQAIGMAEKVTFGFLEGNDYVWKTFEESVEITSLNGNISWDDEDNNKPLIHLHGTISDESFKAFGGHFKDGIVSGVVELFITEISKEKVFKKHFGLVDFKTLDI